MSTPDLAGILGRPRRAQQPTSNPPAEADELAIVAGPAAIPAPAEPSRKVRKLHNDENAGTDRRPQPESQTAVPARSYLQPITVYLPRSLYERLLRASAAAQISRTALMLTAVNAIHEGIAAALVEAPVQRGSLFDVPQARNIRSEPSFQTSIRVTDQQLAVLDELAEQHQTTRSKLLATAVDLYLE